MNPKISKLSTASSYKASTLTHDDVIDSAITVPPDGGWGWVVVMAAFLCNFIADGSIYTFGIFLQDISKSFDVPPTTVAVGNSLMAGPITCAMVNRCGFQLTGFLGGAVAATAFFVSALQSSILAFLIIFGLIGGFGFGMVYVPSIVVIGFYFEKLRALATSVAVTGSAAGIIGFPYIVTNILGEFDWRTKFKIVAGGCFVSSFLALLYLPLKHVEISSKNKKAIECLSEMDSLGSLYVDQKPGFFKRIFHRFHNVTYPTAAQVHKDSTIVLSVGNTSSSSSTLLTASGLDGGSTSTFVTTPKMESRASKLDKLSTVYETDSAQSNKRCRRCCKRICFCRKWFHWARRNRPMYRDDIFYTGSLYHLPGYSQSRTTSQTSRQQSRLQQHQEHLKKIFYSQIKVIRFQIKNIEYHMSVTRVVLREKRSEKVHFQCCHESVIRTLVTMLNLSLLKSPSFFILALSGAFSLLGMFIPFVYLIERARECGIDDSISIHLYTALGASNAIGRVFSGVISIVPHTKPLVISYISILICGIATAVSYFLRSVVGQFIYTSIFGLTI
ncbi:monocarboxylate transporter 3, partial [Asbolus verrucosus]